jgi:hypothetical protein
MATYGDATAALIEDTYAQGAQQVAVLLRHSARTFHPDINDLDNQLTDEGRALASRLGGLLPKGLKLRGYASPAQRCMDTAELMLGSYAASGGVVTRTRQVEAFGVFYALDQQRMWKGFASAGGMIPYVQKWFAGEIPSEALMPTQLAASLVCHVLAGRLDSPIGERTLDVCVTHDLTVHLVREALLGQVADLAPVEFLDALVMYRSDGNLMLASHHGPAAVVSAQIPT